MIRFKIIFILTFFSLCCLGQNEAEKIFIEATNRLLTTNLEMSLNQKTTDKRGRIKEKTFDVLIAKFGEEEKTKMTIQKPERATGITIVMSKLPNEEGIIEVFTPANGKTRKMIANQKNMATVGSDFSFSNYSSTNWEALDIKLLDRNDVEDNSSYLLEVKDKDKTKSGKAELVIEQNSYNLTQISTYDENGMKKSISKLSDFQPVDGMKNKFQPMLISTESLAKKQKTEMQILRITSQANLKEEDFLIDKNQ